MDDLEDILSTQTHSDTLRTIEEESQTLEEPQCQLHREDCWDSLQTH
jgi:hypothetical protein